MPEREGLARRLGSITGPAGCPHTSPRVPSAAPDGQTGLTCLTDEEVEAQGDSGASPSP